MTSTGFDDVEGVDGVEGVDDSKDSMTSRSLKQWASTTPAR
jgi:hypothetical protein